MKYKAKRMKPLESVVTPMTYREMVAQEDGEDVGDLYNEDMPYHSDELQRNVEEEVDDNGLYDVEKVVGKRSKRWGKKFRTEYLVKWDGYEDSYNSWMTVKDLYGCEALIEEYERSLELQKTSNYVKFVDTALTVGCLVMVSVFTYLFVSVIDFPFN